MFSVASVLLTVTIVAIVVTVHYETLNRLSIRSRKVTNHRITVLLSMYGILAAHFVEIWLFAGGFAVFDALGLGQITLPADPQASLAFLDYVYYSGVIYTTVGFGDMLPIDGMRLLTNATAVTGLALITWSASFTFLLMQRLWDD